MPRSGVKTRPRSITIRSGSERAITKPEDAGNVSQMMLEPTSPSRYRIESWALGHSALMPEYIGARGFRMRRWGLGPVLLGVALIAPALAQTSSIPNIQEGTSHITWNDPVPHKSSASPVSVELKWRFSTLLDEPVRELFGRYRVGGWGLLTTATILNAPVCTQHGVMPSTESRTLGPHDMPMAAWQQALEKIELLPVSTFRLHFGAGNGATGRLYMEMQADSLARAESSFTELRIPESPAWGRLFRIAAGAQPAPDDPWLDEASARAAFARGLAVRQAEMIDARFDMSAVRGAYEDHLKATCQPTAQQRAGQTKSDLVPEPEDAVPAKTRPTVPGTPAAVQSSAKSGPLLDISALGGRASESARTGGKQGTESAPVVGDNDVRASLMLLIDASGSMRGERITEAKRAAKDAIARAAASGGTEFSVASFSGDCAAPSISILPFTRNRADAERFIDNISASGGTPLGPAVVRANRHLDAHRAPTSAMQMIILLADGADSCNDLDAQVTKLKRDGVLFRHETIGLEVAPGSDAATQLQRISGASGGAYHRAARSEDLSASFDAAIENVRMLEMLGGFGAARAQRSPSTEPKEAGTVNWNILNGAAR